jgi:phosphoesterase RecJ-like protein
MSGSGGWDIDVAAAQEARELLQAASFVLMPTHQNVDADGLASPLAMMHALDQLGVEARPLVTDRELPDSLRFLPGFDRVLHYGEGDLPDFDLVCLVDCADRRRLGQFSTQVLPNLDPGIPIVNIDHHITNDHFGTVNIVVPQSASAAEIVAKLVRAWNVKLTVDLAQCLLAGIYGDTLGLRTEATNSQTMRIAADLVDAGANPADITDQLFRFKPVSTVCLWEHALRAVEWEGKLIWTEVTHQTLEACKAKALEGEGIVNFLSGTIGSRAAAMLYQTEDGWRVSMRSLSADVDVAAIAAKFGGGGHPRAAGCQIIGGIPERDAFLRAVAALIETPAPHLANARGPV